MSSTDLRTQNFPPRDFAKNGVHGSGLQYDTVFAVSTAALRGMLSACQW